jgi:hypothetical protein
MTRWHAPTCCSRPCGGFKSYSDFLISILRVSNGELPKLVMCQETWPVVSIKRLVFIWSVWTTRSTWCTASSTSCGQKKTLSRMSSDMNRVIRTKTTEKSWCAFQTRNKNFKKLMANLYRSVKQNAPGARFQHVPGIEKFSDEQLAAIGYYRGFVCPHGHVIRHVNEHWCYTCIRKISSNICGFDINYLHTDYKVKYQKLWGCLQVGSFSECWEIQNNSKYAPKRFCFPSYRSLYSKQKAENVTFHKAIYQCAWGDIGSHVVTRTCGNVLCGNPLHLTSSWNRPYPPKTIAPFDIKFNPDKLMHYVQSGNDSSLQEAGFKKTIMTPKKVKDRSE